MSTPRALTPLFRQVYASAAVVAFVATFAPLFSPYEASESYATMNLWSATSEMGGDNAVLGLVLMLVLVSCLFVAAAREERSPGLAVTIITIALFGLLMLITKPGTETPAPSLGAGGAVLLGLTILLIAAAVADVTDQVVRGLRRTREA